MPRQKAIEIGNILVDVDPVRGRRDAPELPSIARARQIALATGATLNLFLCDHLGSLAGGVFFDNQSLKESRDRYMRELQEWLDGHAAALRDQGIRARSEVAWHSPRFEAILDKAEELHADLVVRAARHHSRINRLFFAATDWELIRRAPQLLWLVKTNLDPASRGIRVLAAVDPVHPEEKKAGLDRKLLMVAEAFVSLFGGSLHLFHAYDPGATVAPVAAASHHGAVPALRMSSELMTELERQRKKEVTALASYSGIPDDRVHLVAGSIRDELADLVDTLEIDVVVTGAVARGRLERLLLGNTAEAILDDVRCDVIVVKPDDFPAPRAAD